MGIAAALIAIIQSAPLLINEATELYQALKGDLSESDIAKIDAALATAQAADAAATAKADVALDAASQQ